MTETLTADQDALLRRLAALAALGALSGPMAELYEDLRSRDRRTSVRPVAEVVMPIQRDREAGPIVHLTA